MCPCGCSGTFTCSFGGDIDPETTGGAANATEETNRDASVNAIFFIKNPYNYIELFIMPHLYSVEKEA
jgi:hypothetical protein